jgi:dynein heavy chain 1
LAYIREDLEDLLACSRGEKKQDNRMRALIAALTKGVVPQTWLRYTVPVSATAVEWMKDFGERVKQLAHFSSSENLREECVWLGGLFAPEAYITATRQLIAQNNGWSLEQVSHLNQQYLLNIQIF